VIGPGGKMIRSLQEQYGVKIDIEDDGSVFVSGAEGVGAEQALAEIEKMTEEIKLGRIYTGKVVRIESYGAFVEIAPGRMAWCTSRSWPTIACRASRKSCSWRRDHGHGDRHRPVGQSPVEPPGGDGRLDGRRGARA
jgi:polyribonucleotide nucleotidyltransferase